jgi:hypothetical protein
MRAGVRRGVQRAVNHAVTRLVGEALDLGVAAFLGRDTNSPAGQKPEPEHRRESSQISAAHGGAAPLLGWPWSRVTEARSTPAYAKIVLCSDMACCSLRYAPESAKSIELR